MDGIRTGWIGRLLVFGALGWFLSRGPAHGEDAGIARDPAPVESRECRFDPAAGVIAVPVSLDGATRQFWLATVEQTAFSTRVGERLRPYRMEAEDSLDEDPIARRYFVAPETRFLGQRLRFPLDVAYCHDPRVATSRDALELDGVLGPETLLGNIWQIDFQQGIVRHLSAVPDDAGMRLPIVSLQGNSPVGCIKVLASVGGDPEDEFYVMLERDDAVYVNPELFRQLVFRGALHRIRFENTLGPDCNESEVVGLVDSVQIGGREFRNVRAVHDGDNILGRGFLSRFLVTFDFIHGAMYLKEQETAAFEGCDVSGLTLRWKTNAAVVEKISRGPAERVFDLSIGHEITRINDVPATRANRFKIRELLRRENETLSLRFRHPTGEQTRLIKLEAPQGIFLEKALKSRRFRFPPEPPAMPVPPRLSAGLPDAA